MPAPQTAQQVFDQVFLELRAKLLEVAASLDRLDRADGAAGVAHDMRLTKIQRSLDVIRSQRPNRAEQIQLIFSDDYTDGWQRPSAR